MRIVYLDQNKWIELARAKAAPDDNPETYALLTSLDRAVRRGAVVAPLSAATLVETSKINNPARRARLAYVQAICSQGIVFRSRHARLALELDQAFAAEVGRTLVPLDPRRVLSDVYLEAVAEFGRQPGQPALPAPLLAFIREQPAEALRLYLAETPEDERRLAVRIFSEASRALCERIEARRQAHAQESASMKRNVYSAMLMIDTVEVFFERARAAGFEWVSSGDAEEAVMRRVFEATPAYFVEREIALRLEMQNRTVADNDLRDMQAFGAAVPYADLVIGERQFINLARQAGFASRFGVQLETDLRRLGPWLDQVPKADAGTD